VPTKPPETPLYDWLYSITAGITENRAYIEFQTTGELPDEFLVYYLVSQNPQKHYSNQIRRTSTRISFCYVNRTKAQLEAKGALIMAMAQNNGMLYITTSADVYYKDTDHWARTIDFRLLEEVTP